MQSQQLVKYQMKRDTSNIKKVLIRDLNLCRACGMSGKEVHHIIPMIMGGRDEIDNMITLCSECHRFAPNTPEEFENYLNLGGKVIPDLYGIALRRLEEKGAEPAKVFPQIKKMINSIVLTSVKIALEEYKILVKEALSIKDVSFKKLNKEYSSNHDKIKMDSHTQINRNDR